MPAPRAAALRAVLVVLAVLAVVTGAPGAAPAVAAATTSSTSTTTTTSTSTSSTSTSSTSGVHLRLDSLSPAAVGPSDQVSVVVTVVNRTSSPLTGARVRLFVNSPVLTSRSALASWAADEGVQGGDRFVGVEGAERALTTTVPAGGSADLTITVSAAQLRLGSAWGPRGVTVDVLDSHLTRLDHVRTFLVWTPSRATLPRAGLTVLSPVVAGAPDLTTGAVAADRLAGLTSGEGRLARVVGTAAAGATTLVLDPAVLGTPVPGTTSATSASSTTQAWQQAVAAASGTGGGVALLPLDDADLSSASAARTGQLYRTATDEGRQRAATVLPAAATGDVLAWPVAGSVDADDLAMATATGASGLVLSSAGTSAAPGRATPVSGGQRSRTPAVVVDATASAVLASGTTAGSAAGPAATAARLLADAAVAARGGDDVVLATPRTWDPDPAAASAVLAALARAPWVRTQPLAALLDTSASGTATVPASTTRTSDLPADGLRAVAAAVDGLQPVAAAVARPEALLAPVRERALAATSTAWRGQPTAWRTGVTAITRAGAAQADGVRVLRGSPITVISSRVNLPVTLQNDLDQDVSVVVGLRSGSLRVQAEGRRTTVLAAGATQQVKLPIRALASGDAKLTVVLRTTSGGLVSTGGPVQVRIRAHWEGRGVAAVGALVVLVLLVGVVRTVRRVRRDRRTPPEPLSGGGTGGGADDDQRAARAARAMGRPLAAAPATPTARPAPAEPRPSGGPTPRGGPAAASREGADADRRDRTPHQRQPEHHA